MAASLDQTIFGCFRKKSKTKPRRLCGRNYYEIKVVKILRSLSFYACVVLIREIFLSEIVIADEQQSKPNITELLGKENQRISPLQSENTTKLVQQNYLNLSLPPTINGQRPPSPFLGMQNYRQPFVQTTTTNPKEKFRNEQVQNDQTFTPNSPINEKAAIVNETDLVRNNDNSVSINNIDNNNIKTVKNFEDQIGKLEDSFLLENAQVTPLIRHIKVTDKNTTIPIGVRGKRTHRKRVRGRKREREVFPKFIDIAKKPFVFPRGGKHTAATTLNQQKRCQFDDGTLWPSATLCDDALGEDACKSIFGSGGNPRSILCHNPTMDHLVRKCAKTCKVCCEVTKYDCTNSADGIIDCDKHRAKCYDPVWYNVMMATCEHTCGFCDADKCFAADGCDTLQPLCQHSTFGEIMRIQCALTCGHCKPTTSKMVENLLHSLDDTTNSKKKKKFEVKGSEEDTALKPKADQCVDRLPTCVLQKKLCDDRRYAQLMTEKCAKTCNFCHTTLELGKGSSERNEPTKEKGRPPHRLGKSRSTKKREKKDTKLNSDDSTTNNDLNFTLSGELITKEKEANEALYAIHDDNDSNEFQQLTTQQFYDAERQKRGFDDSDNISLRQESLSKFEGLSPDEITFIKKLEELDGREDGSLKFEQNGGRKEELNKEASAKSIYESDEYDDSNEFASNLTDDVLEAFKQELRKLIDTNRFSQQHRIYDERRISEINAKKYGRRDNKTKSDNNGQKEKNFRTDYSADIPESLEHNSTNYDYDQNDSGEFNKSGSEDHDTLDNFFENLRNVLKKKQRRNDEERRPTRSGHGRILKNILSRNRIKEANLKNDEKASNSLERRKRFRNKKNTRLKAQKMYDSQTSANSTSEVEKNEKSEESLKKILLAVLEKLQKSENNGSKTSNFTNPNEEFKAANSEGVKLQNYSVSSKPKKLKSKLDLKNEKNFNNLKTKNKSESIEQELLESNSYDSSESNENGDVAEERTHLIVNQRIKNQNDRRHTVHEISRQLRGLFNSEERSHGNPLLSRRRAKRSVGDVYNHPDFHFDNFSSASDTNNAYGSGYDGSKTFFNLRLSNGDSVRSNFEPRPDFSSDARGQNNFLNVPENISSADNFSQFNVSLGEKIVEDNENASYENAKYAQSLPSFNNSPFSFEAGKQNQEFSAAENVKNEKSGEIRFSPDATPFGFEHRQYDNEFGYNDYPILDNKEAETAINRRGFGSAKKMSVADNQQTFPPNEKNEVFQETPSILFGANEDGKTDSPIQKFFDNTYSDNVEYFPSTPGTIDGRDLSRNDSYSQEKGIFSSLEKVSDSEGIAFQAQRNKNNTESSFDPLKDYIQLHQPNMNALYSENLADPDSMLFLQAGLSPPLVVYQGEDEVLKNNKQNFAAGIQPGIKATSDSIENLVDNFETKRPLRITPTKNRRRKFDGVLRDKNGARFQKSEIDIRKAIKKIENEYGTSEKKNTDNEKRKKDVKESSNFPKIPKRKISTSFSSSSSSSSEADENSESSILSKERKITKELKEILHDLIMLKRSKYIDSDDRSNEDLRKFLLAQQKQRRKEEADQILNTRRQKNKRKLLLLRDSQDENGSLSEEINDDAFESVEKVRKNRIRSDAVNAKRKLLLVENRRREPTVVIRAPERYVIDRNTQGGSVGRVLYEAYNPTNTLVRASPNGEPIAFGPRSPPTDYADNTNPRLGSSGPIVLAPRVNQGNLTPGGASGTITSGQSRPNLLNTGGFTHVDVGAGFGPIPADLCKDYYPYCEQITPSGFCASGFYPLKMKREFCPQSCGLC